MKPVNMNNFLVTAKAEELKRKFGNQAAAVAEAILKEIEIYVGFDTPSVFWIAVINTLKNK